MLLFSHLAEAGFQEASIVMNDFRYLYEQVAVGRLALSALQGECGGQGLNQEPFG